MSTDDRSPKAELSKRAAEAGGALAAAAKAVGLEDHRRMLLDHAKRVRDGHRCMMKAAGFEPTEEPTDAGEEMGDIIITGDNYYGAQPGGSPAAITPAVTPPQAAGGLPAWAKTLALVAAGLAGGAGGAYLMRPAAVDTDTDTRSDFELSVELPSETE